MGNIINTPLNNDDREIKINAAASAYAKYMDIVLPGWDKDPNSRDTPNRVAKSTINELYSGIFGKKPKITAFANVDRYDGIVLQSNIAVKSKCSHHHLIFFGTAHVAYIPMPDGKIIGLSKLNRIVDYCSRRPQVQENLTMQIHTMVNECVGTNAGVAVYIEAVHTCVCHRGVQNDSAMKTAKMSGYFFENTIGTKDEFYKMIGK